MHYLKVMAQMRTQKRIVSNMMSKNSGLNAHLKLYALNLHLNKYKDIS